MNTVTVKSVLKHLANIMSAIVAGLAAYVFIVYGLSYKNFDFIAENFVTLVSVSGGLIFALIISYILFYVFEKQAAFRLIFCLLVCIALFSAMFFAVCATSLINKINSVEGLRQYIAGFGSLAVILFIFFQFSQVVFLPIPGSVSVAAGVLLFGEWQCCLYSFIGIVTGSIVAFVVGKLIGYRAVSWIVGKENLDKWLKKLKGKDYLILSLMFILPLFPDDILCFVAGLSSMTWGYFIIMIIVTRAVSIVTTVYSIAFIPFNTWWGILIWVTIVAAVIASFILVLKYSDKIDKFVKRKHKLLKSKGDK